MIRVTDDTNLVELLAEMPNLLSFSCNHNYHLSKVATTPPRSVVEWHQLKTVSEYAYSHIRSLTITSFEIAKEVVKNPSSHSLSETTFFRLWGEGTIENLAFKFQYLVKEGAYLHCSDILADITTKPICHTLRGFGNNNPITIYQV